MASLEGDDLVPVIFYNLRASKKSGLIRRVTHILIRLTTTYAIDV
jgi:hypothetical protein